MKKSTRKIINHLRQYIGHEIIRTKPTCGDWSYIDGAPLLLVGFTSDGCLRCHRTGFDLTVFREKEHVLPLYFTDRNWVTYKKVLRPKNNQLNKWRGKKIRRIQATSTSGDKSYMNGIAPTLISASKHHMVIMYNDADLRGKKFVLGPDYAKPEDWVLDE